MSSRTITFRFSDEVINVIEAQARATGSNRTAVVLNALTECYGVTAPTSSAIDRLQQQVHQLENRLSQLSEQLAKIQQGTNANSNTLDLSATTIHSTITAPSVSPAGLVAVPDGVEERSVQLQTTNSSAADSQHALLTQLTYQTGLLDQILSASSEMIFILDRRQRFTYTNSVSRRVLKVERNYILGKTLQEIDPVLFEEAFLGNCEQVFADGQTIHAEFTISATNQTKVFEYSLNPIYGINDEIVAVICIARNITRQKQTDLDIQEVEKNYHNLFELANDSIFIAELATQRILNVNQKASRRLGYTRHELLQLTMNDVMTLLSADRKEEILQNLQATGSAVFEHQQRHKNGKIIPVECSCHMVEYEGKLAVQSFIRDVTEYKQIEEQLRQLEMTLASAMTANATENIIENATDIEGTSESSNVRCSCCGDENQSS